MYELLIRIETLYTEAATVWLAGVGAAMLLVGLLFWLAGAYFSGLIIGLIGAAMGAFVGLFVSHWLGPNPLLAMTIGAAVFCLTAVLFRNVIVIVLAIIVFALATGTAYSSVLLGRLPPLHEKGAGVYLQSFSRMDSSLRSLYLEDIAQTEAGFLDKLNALLKDTVNTMAPYRWRVLLAVLGGIIACLILLWILKRLVFALSYSLIGAFLLFLGAESLLMAAKVQFCSFFQGRCYLLTPTYFVLVIIGAVVQLLLTKHHKHQGLGKEELEALTKAAAPTRT